MYDLIAQGVTIMAVVYFGWHLRTQLRTVKSTVEAQKATIEAQAEQMKTLKTAIDAQAEQMKAQSTVLQDVERHSKIMQQVIDFFDPQAQLQREQAYRDRVDRDLKVLEDDLSKMRQEWIDAQTMARKILLLLDKAADRLERDLTLQNELRLELQEGSIVMKEARLVMQEGKVALEKDIKLRQKLKNKTSEDKTREQTYSSPSHELTADDSTHGGSHEQP